MDLLNLKAKSVKSQLSYLKVDLEYKQKMVEEGDKDFLSMMNEVLDENPELKKSYFEKEEKRKEKIIEDILNKAQEDEQKYQEEVERNLNEDIDEDDSIEPNEEQENTKPQKDSKIKKLYRQIVKLTHPDKIDDSELNSLYLNATMYYDTNNLYGIYMICDELDIEYDIEESEVIFMDRQINDLKKEIGFIEGTYTWKWSTAPSDDIKRQIIIEFINMKLNSGK